MSILGSASYFVLLFVACMTMPDLALAELQKGDAPITLTATPQAAAPGTTITLSGDIQFVALNGKVQINGVPPGNGATQVKLSADITKSSLYKIGAAYNGK